MPYDNGDPKKAHHFDNHPYKGHKGLHWGNGKENENYYLGFRVQVLGFVAWGCMFRVWV